MKCALGGSLTGNGAIGGGPPSESGVFNVVLIKPTHYDRRGYPIQFQKSAMPSNTLACMNGLVQDVRKRHVLGPGVAIRVLSIDESNQRVVPAHIIRDIGASGGRALIALVGVQSNQFPRAIDLARPFLSAGLPVCMGGFHVSGCVAMFPELTPELKEAQAMGISLFAGEAEDSRLDRVFRDAWSGSLAPLYNHLNDLPCLEGAPAPYLAPEQVERITQRFSCLDLGRGCPFQCSFCTIINVQGRKSRSRSADDLERILRDNYARGIRSFFITDDNFARNTAWESLFDRMILLRREGMQLNFSLQIDTLCHKIPGFIDKAVTAGVRQVFIGLENINPDNLIGAKKRQNKITDYRALLQKWHEHGVIKTAGYILGFPGDTKQSILRDIEIIKKELPLDLLQFSYLTPLPGCEDHKVGVQRGDWMDPDLNKYDFSHRCSHHPKMSDEEWEDAYRMAWSTYYTPEHIRTVLRRAARNPKRSLEGLAAILLRFATGYEMHTFHPIEVGIGRMVFREDRRYGMPIEDLADFNRSIAEASARQKHVLDTARADLLKALQEVQSAPDRFTYTDIAVTPQSEEEFASLELYHATNGGEAALARKLRADAIRVTGRAATPVS